MNAIYTLQSLLHLERRTSNKSPHQPRNSAGFFAKTVASLLACVLALLGSPTAGAQSYTATFVAPDPDFPVPSLAKLNDHGEIVGHYFPLGREAHPLVWRNGTYTALPLLAGTSGGAARAINNAGQIVGYCFDEAGTSRACIWENGIVRPLPSLPGTFYAEATDINDIGGAIGYALAPATFPDGTVGYRQDAVVWQGDTIRAIIPPDPEVQIVFAQAIDASGRVAVTVDDGRIGTWRPGRWTPEVPNGVTGAVEYLDWDWGGSACDISDSGAVCGNDYAGRAAFWDGSGATVIGVLPGHYWALANSINGNNTVVGISVAFDYEGIEAAYAAFVWTHEHGMRDLNALLSNNVGGEWTLTNALTINNEGQILAMSDNAYVLLTPSPLPPPLPAPTGLTSQAGDQVVALTWSPVTVATAYNVKRSSTSGGPYTTIASGVSGTSYLDQTAVNGIRYYYVVTALDETRESANSNQTSARPLATPLAPTGLTAKATRAKVQLTWRQSTSPEILRNRIYRATNGGGYVLIAEIPAGLTWTDNQARSKTNYSYVVTAVNSIGLESPASNAVSARPK
jgi:probable HAF family extracellular repeat protein